MRGMTLSEADETTDRSTDMFSRLHNSSNQFPDFITISIRDCWQNIRYIHHNHAICARHHRKCIQINVGTICTNFHLSFIACINRCTDGVKFK